jgi:hypothetical protein
LWLGHWVSFSLASEPNRFEISNRSLFLEYYVKAKFFDEAKLEVFVTPHLPLSAKSIQPDKFVLE